MKATLIIFCLSMGMISCGKLSSQRFLRKATVTGNIAGLEEPLQHTFKLTELKIAQRVCNSLKTKRTSLETLLTTTPATEIAYGFTLERKDCKNKSIEAVNITAQILLSSNDLEFSTNESPNYFKNIITDKTAALAHICTEIFNTKTPTLEEKIISNADIILNTLYFVTLTTDDKGFDTVQINTKTATSNGSFNPLSAQLISIFTDPAQVSDQRNIGVEKEHNEYIPCSNSEFTTRREVFVRSVFL